MVFFAIAIYVVVVLFVVVDVLRQPALSVLGKTLWIVGLFLFPIVSILVYGFWRISRSGGVPSV